MLMYQAPRPPPAPPRRPPPLALPAQQLNHQCLELPVDGDAWLHGFLCSDGRAHNSVGTSKRSEGSRSPYEQALVKVDEDDPRTL